MAYKSVTKTFEVASIDGSQANGPWFRVGGNTFNVQHNGPAALGVIEVSNDKLNVVVNSTALADNTLTQVATRPVWMRVATLTDTSGPRNFQFIMNVFKEQDK